MAKLIIIHLLTSLVLDSFTNPEKLIYLKIIKIKLLLYHSHLTILHKMLIGHSISILQKLIENLKNRLKISSLKVSVDLNLMLNQKK